MAVILRDNNSHGFGFVGTANVHGLKGGEALLGPLSDGYKVVVGPDHNGDECQIFVNTAHGTQSTKDPRLDPLPPEWELIVTKDRLWGTKKVKAFRSKNTGKIMFSDPRLLQDALTARGVPLQRIRLCHQDFDIPETSKQPVRGEITEFSRRLNVRRIPRDNWSRRRRKKKKKKKLVDVYMGAEYVQ